MKVCMRSVYYRVMFKTRRHIKNSRRYCNCISNAQAERDITEVTKAVILC
jgi:hypothetical protein